MQVQYHLSGSLDFILLLRTIVFLDLPVYQVIFICSGDLNISWRRGCILTEAEILMEHF